MNTRTLFIGLDGATFRILDDLTAGTDNQPPVMPFLARIYREGARCPLQSTPNPLTPPAWVSLMTGKTPGRHGILDFIRAEEHGEDVFFTLYDARDCLAQTIWSIADRGGKRVAALNFPFTAPPPSDFSGFMVPGFVPFRHLRRNTLPPDLFDCLANLPGFNARELAWDFNQEKQAVKELSDHDRETWVRYHLPRERQWFMIADYILSKQAPDLMAVMFDGVDKLQHQAWPYLDPANQTGQADDYHRRMRELCLTYFAQLDGFIENLVSAAGPDTQVFMASDHGFTTTHEVVRINAWLHQKGYLQWKTMPATEQAARREDSMFANLDWSKTLAYCRTPSSNGITIRVARRPGQAGIAPRDYETFRDQLIEELYQLRDPSTGEQIISNVHKREAVFAGPAMDQAPDLLLELRDYGFVSINNKQPVVQPRPQIAGTHHPDGVFFAWGPGISQAGFNTRLNITDVGAILLYSQGLDVPDDFDGRVPQALFTAQQLNARPVVRGSAAHDRAPADTQEEISDADRAKLMAQLKMLGYME